MIGCKSASAAVSRSLDHALGFGPGLGLALHLALCRTCRRFQRQSRLIQAAWIDARNQDDRIVDATVTLSDHARERIKRALHPRKDGVD